MKKIEKTTEEIIDCEEIAALTGAGISVESGIPPFRGEGGLWERYDPREYAHINALKRNPSKVWKMLQEIMETVLEAKPNPGHKALARLEELGFLSSIITQNVDGLHQKAGNTNVIEFHGNIRRLNCMDCEREKNLNSFLEKTKEKVPNCKCGGIMRPDIIFFGEPIPRDVRLRARAEAENCDLMFLIGTSAVVEPAASIPRTASNSSARIIEINPKRTSATESISNYLIKGRAGEVLPKIVSEVRSYSSY